MHAILNGKPKTAVNLFSATVALSYVGSDEGEYWTGDSLRNGYAAHTDENGPSVVTGFEVEAWECGDFGWSRSFIEIKFENAQKPVLARQTMVVLLEDGIWKIAHVHNSNPVSNVEASGHTHKALKDLVAAVGEDELKLDASGSATVMFTDIVGRSGRRCEVVCNRLGTFRSCRAFAGPAWWSIGQNNGGRVHVHFPIGRPRSERGTRYSAK